MAKNTIDAVLLSRMFIAGAKKLEASKELINELNVFPVPDGDTGTNMTLTIMTAAQEVAALEEKGDMAAVCKAISSGSLRGARGNSGVILSQLLRGFTNIVSEHKVITVELLAEAMEKAVETAYKAVMKPKEGTILTVAREAAERGRALVKEGVTDMTLFLDEVIRHADETLQRTPELLPVLKEAGVIDSGGQGLMEILKGAYDIFLGKELDLTVSAAKTAPWPKLEAKAEAEIEFGYCTEFIIMLNKHFNVKQEMDFKAFLESVGDSIVVVADGELVKVHVHTNDPGLVLQNALKYGELSGLKIDNMRLEHQETLFKEEKTPVKAVKEVSASIVSGVKALATKASEVLTSGEKPPAAAPAALPAEDGPEAPPAFKEVGFIAVAAGEGIKEIFTGLGVDHIIEGGQTMNPSTEDILMAISQVNSQYVYVLPNNKNIILAANQAAELVNDKEVIVLPTTTVPQGITAVVNFVPDLGIEENTATMNEEMAKVKTGQVTYAVRDTQIDGKEIHAGDYMSLTDEGISAAGTKVNDVAYQMIAQMTEAGGELISIYYGEDISETDADALKQIVQTDFAGYDIEMQNGGQPIYYYIVSVE